MQAKDIIDKDTLEAWLRGRSQVESITIATRAALRVAPLWFAAMQQDWARKTDLTSLPVLRCLLTSLVACKYPTDDVKSAAASCVAASSAINAAAFFAFSTIAVSAADFASVAAAAFSAADSAAAADRTAFSAAAVGSAAKFAAWTLVRVECEQLEAGETLDGLPLWHTDENLFLAAWTETQTLWSAPNSPYAFWLRWYEAALKGMHINLPLEQDIAMIPDDDWQKGPDHIAAIIAAMEKRHDLLVQVITLRKQLTLSQAQAASEAQRSHNNPPELLDTAPEVQRQITIVFDALKEAEAELTLLAPSPSRLKKIGQALIDAVAVIAKYLGGKADTVLQKAAGELGTSGTKWAFRYLVASFAAPPVLTLGQKLLDYAQKLSAMP
jgi:hypothetical protein